MLNFIKENFILLDAEVLTLEALALMGDYVGEGNFNYMYILGLVYAIARLYFYIKNQILTEKINKQKLKSWEILNDKDFKTSLGSKKVDELKKLYKYED
jgi:hypothetical protein